MAVSQGTKETNADAATFKSRLTWILLVVVVPTLATVLIIAIALQLVGFPVWSTVVNYAGFGAKPVLSMNPQTAIKRELSMEQTRNSSLVGQVSSLRAQLGQEHDTELSLKNQVKQLQFELKNQVSTGQQAQREALLLSTMDAASAAKVLSHMTLQQGAQVISAMQPTNASDVLAAMDPVLASKLTTLSSQVSVPQSQTAQTGTSNSTY